jgi:hypothetical protein
MKKAKTRISKLVAEPSSLFSKSSNTNSDSSADVEEEAFWMELWVEKQMRTFDLVSNLTVTRGHGLNIFFRKRSTLCLRRAASLD